MHLHRAADGRSALIDEGRSRCDDSRSPGSHYLAPSIGIHLHRGRFGKQRHLEGRRRSILHVHSLEASKVPSLLERDDHAVAGRRIELECPVRACGGLRTAAAHCHRCEPAARIIEGLAHDGRYGGQSTAGILGALVAVAVARATERRKPHHRNRQAREYRSPVVHVILLLEAKPSTNTMSYEANRIDLPFGGEVHSLIRSESTPYSRTCVYFGANGTSRAFKSRIGPPQ